MKTWYFPIQKALIAAAAIFCAVPAPARAQDDHRESVFVFLRDTALDPEESARSEPGSLISVIAEKHHFKQFKSGWEQEAFVSLFYEKYRRTLAAATDARIPATKKLRPRLRALLHAICDFMESVSPRRRDAITHARINAYVEYLMARYSIADEEEHESDVVDVAAAHRDLVTYARVKALLASRDGNRAPDYARYVVKISHLLAAAENAGPGLESYQPDLLMTFIADYQEKLDPDDTEVGAF